MTWSCWTCRQPRAGRAFIWRDEPERRTICTACAEVRVNPARRARGLAELCLSAD